MLNLLKSELRLIAKKEVWLQKYVKKWIDKCN